MDQQLISTIKLVLTVVYALLSATVVWHCVVIVRLVRYIFYGRNKETAQNFIYILALTVVDAIVLLHLPMLCLEIVSEQWIFGLTWCRIFWITESVNKILSTFILTALCFDRYMAIRCWSLGGGAALSRLRIACGIITGCTISAFIVLSPVYLNAALDEIPVSENFTVTKCIIEWDSDETEYNYTIFLFAFGYCIPVIMMTCFYCGIVWYLKQRLPQSFRQRIRTRTVMKRSFALVLFYFVCWTPYWFFTMFIDIYSYSNFDAIIVCFYFTHALVYLNSSLNPVFYALINREVWKKRRTSVK